MGRIHCICIKSFLGRTWTIQLSFCQVNPPSQVFSLSNCKSHFDSSAFSGDFLWSDWDWNFKRTRPVSHSSLVTFDLQGSLLRYWISLHSENNSPAARLWFQVYGTRSRKLVSRMRGEFIPQRTETTGGRKSSGLPTGQQLETKNLSYLCTVTQRALRQNFGKEVSIPLLHVRS